MFGAGNPLYTIPDEDEETFIGFLMIDIEDNPNWDDQVVHYDTVGIAYVSTNVIWIFKGYYDDEYLVSIDEVKKTTIRCTSIQGMNLYKVFSDYLMITTLNEEIMTCTFFLFSTLEILSNDNIIAGDKEFVPYISSSLNLFRFLYVKSNSLYYFEQEIVNSVEKTYSLTGLKPITIEISDLLDREVKHLDENSCIAFITIDPNIGGILTELDGKTEIILDSPNNCYPSVLYYPKNGGTFSIKYRLFMKVTDTFYIPTPNNVITFTNACYSLCGSCDRIGTD